MLTHERWVNWELSAVTRAIVVENKWRAQRYGIEGTFVADAGAETVAQTLERVIEDVRPHAVALGCMAEIERCRMIVGSGTSADVQLAVFKAHKNGDGNNGAHALSAVTDWIATATLQ